MSAHTLTLTVLGVGILVAVTTGVLAVARAPVWWAPAVAVARGTLQLGLIALVLRGVITDLRWVLIALSVMFAVAALTASRRLGRGHTALVAAAMAAGVAVPLAVVFMTGAIVPSARYVLALGGIIIGNTMTVATLTGRRLLSGIAERWEEVEGWLALGATRRRATLGIARDAIHQALIPSTDQTKTTGLVTLPGAFVGAIFGGVSPVEAGRFQIVVLAGIMTAGAITAVLLTRGLAPVRIRPTAPR